MSEFKCLTCYVRHSAPHAPCRCGKTSPSLSKCMESNHEIQLSQPKAVILDVELDTGQRGFTQLLWRESFQREGDHTALTLRLEQIDFGVMGCDQTPKKLGNIIREVGVMVQPSRKMAPQCKTVTGEPCRSPKTFSLSAKSYTPHSTPGSSTLGGKRSIDVGWEADAYGWSSASVDPIDSKHVRWKWSMNFWNDGSRFPTKGPGRSKFFFGSMPKLPLKKPESISYHLGKPETEFEARWLVPNSLLKGLTPIEWELKVDLYTVRFERTGFLGFFGCVASFAHHEERLTF